MSSYNPASLGSRKGDPKPSWWGGFGFPLLHFVFIEVMQLTISRRSTRPTLQLNFVVSIQKRRTGEWHAKGVRLVPQRVGFGTRVFA